MSKFSDKFVDGMSLVAEKVDENKFLGAIKDSFTIYMPFVIVGSFMSLFNTILCSTTTGLAKWIPALEALKPIFTAANFATLSCMTLPIVFLIGLKLGKKNNVPEHKLNETTQNVLREKAKEAAQFSFDCIAEDNVTARKTMEEGGVQFCDNPDIDSFKKKLDIPAYYTRYASEAWYDQSLVDTIYNYGNK